MVVAALLSMLLASAPEPRSSYIVALRGGPVAANEIFSGDVVVTTRWKSFPGFAADLTPDAAERLRHDPRIASVIPDLPGGGALVESGGLIGANIVRAMGHIGEGVTVAVLDSGLDLDHPDFAGRVVDEQCFCRSESTGCCPNGGMSQSGPGAGEDDHGHGTNVTGILASASASHPGIAPGVKLVVVKVLDRNNRFSGLSQVISGVDWVLTEHPEVRVINMSLLTDALFDTHCDGVLPPLAVAADTLAARGGVMFACSGNSGSNTSVGAPSCIERVAAVGAVHDSAASADQIASFTNMSATLDLLGPGVQVTASGLNGGMSTYSGTSQATPHVSGLAAMLMQQGITSPAATSLSQWRLSWIRLQPTAPAAVYSPTVAQLEIGCFSATSMTSLPVP